VKRGFENVQSSIDALKDQGGRIQSTLNDQGDTLNDTGGLVRQIYDHTTEEHVHVYLVPKNNNGDPCGNCKTKMWRENSKTAFCGRFGHGSEERGFVEHDFGKVLSE